MLVEGDFDLGPDLRILLAPGHAPGQLALLLTLPDSGPMLLVSDAISRPDEVVEEFAGSWNEELGNHKAPQHDQYACG